MHIDDPDKPPMTTAEALAQNGITDAETEDEQPAGPAPIPDEEPEPAPEQDDHEGKELEYEARIRDLAGEIGWKDKKTENYIKSQYANALKDKVHPSEYLAMAVDAAETEYKKKFPGKRTTTDTPPAEDGPSEQDLGF